MKKLFFILSTIGCLFFTSALSSPAYSGSYPVIDTGQETCYDTSGVIAAPQPGEAFYGQDAQHAGLQPSYRDNGDGTVTDLNTGLMWQKYLLPGKYTYSQAHAAADTFSLAGYTDWRLPAIKELYSLIQFTGVTGMSAAESTPYLDTTFFEFRYGDESAGERYIDAQYISGTDYTGTTMGGNYTVFGVNFADGRIKGYPASSPLGEKLFEVRFVRGDTAYGINNFADNGDGTVTDRASGLMWSRDDCGGDLNWQQALAWVQQKNRENYLGYDDWRLPDAKELQSIVDYSRSPQATSSPAIDPVFNVTAIVDEGGETDYPFYWTGTTHLDGPPDRRYIRAVYLAFGEAPGYMEIPPNSGNYSLQDVHGAGAQRSDPKVGNPDDYPFGLGPQGDVIRIYNYVRLVRGSSATSLNNTPGEENLPQDYTLQQNYPNPFNPETTIGFTLPEARQVMLRIYNVSGQLVTTLLDGKLPAGEHRYRWNAEGMAGGVYFYTLHLDGSAAGTRKMLLLR